MIDTRCRDRDWDYGRITAAFEMAARNHAGQSRKGSDTPYLGHLLAVTELVMNFGGDDEESAAALLHDSVEDAGGQRVLGEIRARCGERVAAIVAACSDSFVDTTAGQAKPGWLERKQAYIRHLSDADAPAGALLVSACDKLHNLSSTRADFAALGADLWSRFKTGWAGQVWYYRAVLEVYRTAPDQRVRAVAERIADELAGLEAALRAAGYPPDTAEAELGRALSVDPSDLFPGSLRRRS